jgi:hypothetical protein
MLGLRADAWDAQKFVQLVQVVVMLGIDVFRQIHEQSSPKYNRFKNPGEIIARKASTGMWKCRGRGFRDMVNPRCRPGTPGSQRR